MKFTPDSLIEYGSWFNYIGWTQLSDNELQDKITQRIADTVDQLFSVGIVDMKTNLPDKKMHLARMQAEHYRNGQRLSHIRSLNSPFDELCALGLIHERILVGIIERLSQIN